MARSWRARNGDLMGATPLAATRVAEEIVARSVLSTCKYYGWVSHMPVGNGGRISPSQIVTSPQEAVAAPHVGLSLVTVSIT